MQRILSFSFSIKSQTSCFLLFSPWQLHGKVVFTSVQKAFKGVALAIALIYSLLIVSTSSPVSVYIKNLKFVRFTLERHLWFSPLMDAWVSWVLRFLVMGHCLWGTSTFFPSFFGFLRTEQLRGFLFCFLTSLLVFDGLTVVLDDAGVCLSSDGFDLSTLANCISMFGFCFLRINIAWDLEIRSLVLTLFAFAACLYPFIAPSFNVAKF